MFTLVRTVRYIGTLGHQLPSRLVLACLPGTNLERWRRGRHSLHQIDTLRLKLSVFTGHLIFSLAFRLLYFAPLFCLSVDSHCQTLTGLQAPVVLWRPISKVAMQMTVLEDVDLRGNPTSVPLVSEYKDTLPCCWV